ncbi:MAG TPA: glycosyltransferase, partial [Bryobacteraceae bacterium]|nr:glycosyltransferase [Bryobacteraceae bacterium]
MKLVVFGLSISSSWGNGHATLWRALCRALGSQGYSTVFFERDVPYYAEHRDCTEPAGCSLRLYSSWESIRNEALKECSDADVAMVTSYCPDGPAACEIVLNSKAQVRCFYDLDTPVTLVRLRAGEKVEYLPEAGLGGFDLVLSYTGGSALEILRRDLGAKMVAPLYGSVDPLVHQPAPPNPDFTCDLSYLGTYAHDRQAALEELFITPARVRPEMRFVIGGAQYPQEFPWTPNIFFVRHLPPQFHPSFYSSSRATLNVTRAAMAEMGYCPSGRLFEAAACGVPILTDTWDGLEQFYKPGSEIVACQSTQDVLGALELTHEELRRISVAARERTLSEHTATHRAIELDSALRRAYDGRNVGHHTSSRPGEPDTAPGILEGTVAGREPIRRGN